MVTSQVILSRPLKPANGNQVIAKCRLHWASAVNQVNQGQLVHGHLDRRLGHLSCQCGTGFHGHARSAQGHLLTNAWHGHEIPVA